jgi:MFS family permease
MGDRGKSAIRRLAVATFLNSFGSNVAAVALPASIYERTGSTIWLGVTFFFSFGIVGILGPFAGAIADRLDRKRLIVIGDLLAGLAWLVLLLGRDPAWLLAWGFLANVLALPAWPAVGAAIPNLVDQEHLTWANGTLTVARKGSQVFGFALGGILVATFGATAAFTLNALSFFVGAAIVLTVSGRFQAEDEGRDKEGRRGSAFVGFPIIWRNPILRPLFVVWTILFVTIDIALVADLPIAVSFGWGESGYGFINASWALGALAGAFLGSRISRRFEPWAVLIGALGAATGYFMVATAPIFLLVLIGSAMAGGTDAGDEIAGFAIIQRATTDTVRGRVLGSVFSAGFVAQAFGFIVAGFLVESMGPRVTYAICAAGSLATAPMLVPMFRAIRAREWEEAQAEGTSKTDGDPLRPQRSNPPDDRTEEPRPPPL